MWQNKEKINDKLNKILRGYKGRMGVIRERCERVRDRYDKINIEVYFIFNFKTF